MMLAESPICLTENNCKTGFAYSASFAASPDRSLNNLLEVPTRLSILAFQDSITDMIYNVYNLWSIRYGPLM